MPDCFQGQAYIAPSHIVLNVMANCKLVIFLGYELMCFFNTKVACQRIVIMPTNKLCPDDLRDVGETLIVLNPINIIITLLAELLINPELPSLFVFGL